MSRKSGRVVSLAGPNLWQMLARVAIRCVRIETVQRNRLAWLAALQEAGEWIKSN